MTAIDLVVRSGHAIRSRPATIEEVRRIRTSMQASVYHSASSTGLGARRISCHLPPTRVGESEWFPLLV